MRLKALSIAAIGALMAVAVAVQPASAATHNIQCADLPSTIASASAGDVVNVEGECTITTSTVVNKQLTIHGVNGATINTSGSAQLFVFTAAGSTFDGFAVNKTDKAFQNLIGIQGANTTISNNDFTGQYTLALNDHTSRALEVSTTTGVNITGNTFNNLRQPAYINDFTTGTITNNHVNETRGFVIVANTNFTLTGNSWGNNFLDIVFISAGTVPNNYSCETVREMVFANNDAKVENQAQATPCPTYPVKAEDCKNGNHATFTLQTFKNQGQCVSSVVSDRQ